MGLFVELSGCVPIMMTMQDQVNKALVTQAYRLMAITCCNQLNLLVIQRDRSVPLNQTLQTLSWDNLQPKQSH